MTLVVPDASVLVKWVLSAPDEGDLEAAVRLRDAILTGEVEATVPALWLYEVASVLFRRVPQQARDMVAALRAFDLPHGEPTETWFDIAAGLANDYRVTFYDAAYHALALVHEGTFVTADARYIGRAGSAGSVVSLLDWHRGHN